MAKHLFILWVMLLIPSMAFADPQTPVSYTACGCGCCPTEGRMSPMHIVCVSEEEMQKIVAEDKAYAARHESQCAVVGCSMGEKYQVCNKPIIH